MLQADEKNAEDHEFLRSASQRYGLWFSKPGNGVSHPTHMQRFGVPGKTMVGSDSHTCAAGSLGMLAIGVRGLEVALAIAGHPLRVRMPEIWGVRLTGELPPWVSAKDVVLEMLRRHGVSGGVNRIIAYHGPGLAGLSAMDRHVIANMGAERSNIPALAEYTFTRIDTDYPRRTRSHPEGHIVVGGCNYGQGSSREHAAITPRYLGLQVVIAKSYARIHWQNLANFGIVPLEFADPTTTQRSVVTTPSSSTTCAMACRRATSSTCATPPATEASGCGTAYRLDRSRRCQAA